VTSFSHLRTLLVCASLALVAACNPPAEKAKPTDPKACESYTEKLCAELGTTTPACKSATETLGVMPPAACAAGLADLAFTKTKLGDARKKCDELSAKLCKDIGPGELCTMVETQTKTFPASRCEEMMGKYDVVLADLQKMAARTQPLSQEKFTALAAGGAGVPSFGPEGAKVTIVEFSDFQCPFCSRVQGTLEQVMRIYEGRVRIVWKNNPLAFHKQADPAAQLALEARAQRGDAGFWAAHDLLFQNQRKLSDEDLEGYAKELGLDVGRAKQAIARRKYAGEIAADQRLADQVKATGTPMFFINGRKLVGAQPFEKFKAVIDRELARLRGGSAPLTP
jgi:protein-disulfide isomerase